MVYHHWIGAESEILCVEYIFSQRKPRASRTFSFINMPMNILFPLSEAAIGGILWKKVCACVCAEQLFLKALDGWFWTDL